MSRIVEADDVYQDSLGDWYASLGKGENDLRISLTGALARRLLVVLPGRSLETPQLRLVEVAP